jgi:hypothetical protein
MATKLMLNCGAMKDEKTMLTIKLRKKKRRLKIRLKIVGLARDSPLAIDLS